MIWDRASWHLSQVIEELFEAESQLDRLNYMHMRTKLTLNGPSVALAFPGLVLGNTLTTSAPLQSTYQRTQVNGLGQFRLQIRPRSAYDNER